MDETTRPLLELDGTLAVQRTVDVVGEFPRYFWFFSPDNVEVVVKVLDGCAINDRFWVFAGGLTNVGVTLTVTDGETGIRKTYGNPLGAPFQPIQDTSAFATCP